MYVTLNFDLIITIKFNENVILLPRYLFNLVKDRPGFHLLTEVIESPNVCFWYLPPSMRHMNFQDIPLEKLAKVIMINVALCVHVCLSVCLCVCHPLSRLKKKQKTKNKQEAFRERRHLHVCNLLTLSCDLDLKSRSKGLMSLDVDYCIVPWYQV